MATNSQPPDSQFIHAPIHEMPRGTYIVLFLNRDEAALYYHDEGRFFMGPRALLPAIADAGARLILTADGRFRFPEDDLADQLIHVTVRAVANFLGVSDDAARAYVIRQLRLAQT